MSLGLIGLILTLAGMLCAASVAWATLSSQAGALDTRVGRLTETVRSDHDLAIRIDARLSSIEAKLDDIGKDLKDHLKVK